MLETLVAMLLTLMALAHLDGRERKSEKKAIQPVRLLRVCLPATSFSSRKGRVRMQ